jgi:hypothetical protein
MFRSLCTAHRWSFVLRHASEIARCRPALPSMMQSRGALRPRSISPLQEAFPRRAGFGAADLEAYKPLGSVAEDGDAGQHGQAGDAAGGAHAQRDRVEVQAHDVQVGERLLAPRLPLAAQRGHRRRVLGVPSRPRAELHWPI